MSFKILSIESDDFSEEAKGILRSIGEYKDGNQASLQKAGSLKGVNCLITGVETQIDARLLTNAPDLRYILSRDSSQEIDMEAIRKQKIQVLSLNDDSDLLSTVTAHAEHTFGLILSLLKNIPHASLDVMAGNWENREFRGFQLRGKKIGIFGFGRIGKMLASFSLAFGMECGYFENESIMKEDSRYKRFSTIDELLEWSEIICINQDFIPDANSMINKGKLERISPGAWFINSSTSQVVDEGSLAGLLENEIISGIALDKLGHKGSDFTANPLWKLAEEGYNIIISPGLASATYESLEEKDIQLVNLLVSQLQEQN